MFPRLAGRFLPVNHRLGELKILEQVQRGEARHADNHQPLVLHFWFYLCNQQSCLWVRNHAIVPGLQGLFDWFVLINVLPSRWWHPKSFNHSLSQPYFEMGLHTWHGRVCVRYRPIHRVCLFVCLFACWFVGISHHDALQGSGLMKVCGGVLIFFEFSTNYRRAFLAWPRLSMCEPCPVGATCRGGLAPPVSDPGAPLERFGFIREMVCNTWRNFLDDICRTNISEMNGVAMEGCGTEVVPQISMNENRTSWILPLGFKSVIYNHRPENFPKSGCHDLKKNCKSGGNVDSALTGLLRCKIWTNLGSHTFLQKNTCDMWMFPFVNGRFQEKNSLNLVSPKPLDSPALLGWWMLSNEVPVKCMMQGEVRFRFPRWVWSNYAHDHTRPGSPNGGEK